MQSGPLSKALVVAATLIVVVQIRTASQAFKAADPGVRGGDPGVGGPINPTTLTTGQLAAFTAGQKDFAESETVAEGLGPRMNLDSCVGCHLQPAIGGSSPAVNPQAAFGAMGTTDVVPSFISPNGPVREARFVRNSDGTPDGGVHALFTISGRGTDPDCTLAQPDFAAQLAARNVVFRIPTPTFGDGLIEAIPDSAVVTNQLANASAKSALGIRGRANSAVAGRTITGQKNANGNDGTIARFGWKAQNKSLLLFAGEAYNVEMGISNELFQSERDEASACQYADVPNSVTNVDPMDLSSIEKFAAGPREFRTAPLWGVGQRIFLLHDGRTSNLLNAIRAHASTGSEANSVVAGFMALAELQKQDLFNFLRSL